MLGISLEQGWVCRTRVADTTTPGLLRIVDPFNNPITLSLSCRSSLEALPIVIKNITTLLLVHGETTGKVTTIKSQLSASKEHFSLSEKTYSCSLFLPGMFAPMYQESEIGKSVLSLSSVTLRFHSSSASRVALRKVMFSLRSLASASMIQSPWHSTHDGPLLNAVGPWAP
jgi:hypothetical protein